MGRTIDGDCAFLLPDTDARGNAGSAGSATVRGAGQRRAHRPVQVHGAMSKTSGHHRRSPTSGQPATVRALAAVSERLQPTMRPLTPAAVSRYPLASVA